MKILTINIYFFITLGLSLINGILLCFLSYKFFQIIQLSNYKLKGYVSWLKDTKSSYISRLLLLSLLSGFCVLVTNALFDVYHSSAIYSYLGLIFYFYFSIVFINNLYSSPKKVPLKYTTRMTRMTILMFIISTILSFFLVVISTEYFGFIKFGILCFVPLFLPILVPIVHVLMLPIEKIISTRYVVKAKLKLKRMPNLIKIGITGSFGKTSTKYFLNTILSEKYKVCMSPHSFNTLIGLTKVVNNYLTPNDEILIAEMGARNVGDIKELCNLINPSFGIITGIGSQHMKSFKTYKNILSTKKELVDAVEQNNGFVVFNGKNEGAVKIFDDCNCKKKLIDDNSNSYIQASEISFDGIVTSFVLRIGSEKFECKTCVIGEHNIQNILLAVQMAKELKLSNKQIVEGIRNIKPIPHRLELIKTQNNIILDDSYNANIEGSIIALEALSKLGKRKIVVTPGLVELGDKQQEANKQFGKDIAGVADTVVIVNKINFDAIREGLLEEAFLEDNIYQAENLEKAKEMMKDFLKQDDAILFENDLPDNYI